MRCLIKHGTIKLAGVVRGPGEIVDIDAATLLRTDPSGEAFERLPPLPASESVAPAIPPVTEAHRARKSKP